MSGCFIAPKDDDGPLRLRVVPELRAMAQESADHWNACGGRQVVLTDDEDAIPVVELVDPNNPHPGELVWEGKGDFLGIGGHDRPQPHEIQARPGMRASLEHYIGHALLVSHRHFGEGLMASDGRISGDKTVTHEDCAALFRPVEW